MTAASVKGATPLLLQLLQTFDMIMMQAQETDESTASRLDRTNCHNMISAGLQLQGRC